MKNLSTRKIAIAGMITALCLVVTITIRIPLVPAVSFLKFDGKDTLISIAGFLFGPGYGFLITVLTSLLEPFFTGNATWVDILMNIVSTASFAVTAAWWYRRHHDKRGAVTALALGTVLQILAMTVWNYIVDPFYFQMPREAVVAMLPWIALFNFLKCALNAGIVLFIYKPVVTALRSRGLAPAGAPASRGKTMMWMGVFVLVSAILLSLAVSGMI